MKKNLTKSEILFYVDQEENHISGAHSGLRGNCSELWGNLYYCKITEKERKKGIDIRDLIED